jgi:hypothetical protein
MTGRPVFVESIRENVLFPAPAMPVTPMRLPTIGCVPISLTVLKCSLSISLTMEKKSNEVERWLLADTDYRRCTEVPSNKPLKLSAAGLSRAGGLALHEAW